MTVRGRLSVVLSFVLATGAGLPARQEVDPNVVRARLHDYIAGYEAELSTAWSICSRRRPMIPANAP